VRKAGTSMTISTRVRTATLIAKSARPCLRRVGRSKVAVIARTAALMGHKVSIRSLPVGLARLGATVAGWTRHGGMTPAVIDVITSDETVQANADVELGVTLTPLSATLEKLLRSESEVSHP